MTVRAFSYLGNSPLKTVSPFSLKSYVLSLLIIGGTPVKFKPGKEIIVLWQAADTCRISVSENTVK